MITSRGYYWLGLRDDISNIISKCDFCQLYKKNNVQRMQPMKLTDSRNYPSEKVSIDVVDMSRLRTSRGNKYFALLQDNFSRFIYLEATRQHRVTDVAKRVLNFCCLYEIPKKMLSDNSTAFCSNLMDTLRKELDIEQILCAPYYHQSNGNLKRAHGTLKDYLAYYGSIEKPDEWDKHLRLASSTFNKSKHSSTGLSPHEMVFGRLLHLPIDDDEEAVDGYEELVFQLQDKLRFLHDIARENSDETKEATKRHFDRTTKPAYYKAGDKVLLKNFARPSKLAPHYIGPYEIVRASSHNIDLLINDAIKRHHMQNIKPYSKKLLFALLVYFCLFLSTAFATPLVQQYNNTAGLLFQNLGTVYQKIDEWSLVTTINLTEIRYKLQKLREIYNQTEKVINLPQEHTVLVPRQKNTPTSRRRSSTN